MQSPNSIRLYVNNREDRLIDKYVATNERDAEHKATVFLQGGEAYFFRLETFRFKDPAASMTLSWVPPGGTRQIIPKRNFSPTLIGDSILVQTPFPPDDSASGYERGTAISAEWDEATTNAAIEVAGRVLPLLDQMARTNSKAADRTEKIKSFCHDFIQYAFRRPLTDEHKSLYVDSFFDDELDVTDSVKRVIISTLKSPVFLYPELNRNPDATEANGVDSYLIASRLALALWDSVPDTALRNAADRGDLLDPIKVEQQIKRMLSNSRARSKSTTFYCIGCKLMRKVSSRKTRSNTLNSTKA